MTKKNETQIEEFASSDTNHVDKNNFYIYGIIDESFYKDIVIPFKKEIDIQKELKAGEINIYIKSDGWDLHSTIELLSLMEKAKKLWIPVNTYALSFVASAGSMIAVAWSKRYVSIWSSHLVHYCSGGSYSISKTTEKNNHEYTEYINNYILFHYGKYTKIKELDKKLDEYNHFINWGKELIKLWLADEIF